MIVDGSVAAGTEVFIDFGNDLRGKGGIATIEIIEKKVEHLHGLIDGATVLELLDAGCKEVNGLRMPYVDVLRGVGITKNAAGIRVYEMITLLCHEGGQGAGGLAELVPVALVSPHADGVTIDLEHFCNLAFCVVCLEIQVLRLFAFSGFHSFLDLVESREYKVERRALVVLGVSARMCLWQNGANPEGGFGGKRIKRKVVNRVNVYVGQWDRLMIISSTSSP